MYKNLLFVLIVCFNVIPGNLYAQNIRYDFNKIENREHLNLFYNKLNKKQEAIKILHLGDSHVMMGHFTNEIRRILDSALGIISYGWAFPNQIGKYNTLYTNSKLNTGKRSFYNNLYKEGLYQNVKKTDTSSLFNLLGIYLGNEDLSKGVVYNSLGVGGSNLNSIVNNNSLLIGDIIMYQPDLIILSFGSNDAYYKAFDEKEYKNKIESFIKTISVSQPNVSFLITSPPDSRAKNRIPINLSKIQEVFKQVALKYNNVAYWDLRTIMGGDKSILQWLKPKLASFDKLHYTKEGYILQANLLMNAMLKN